MATSAPFTLFFWRPLLALLLVLFNAGAFSRAATFQEISFYGGPECRGRSETFRNSRDLSSSLVATNASTVRVLGLWNIKVQIQLELDNGQMLPVVTFNYAGQPPNGICLPKRSLEWSRIKLFRSIERIGPADLTTPQIVLGEFARFIGSNMFSDSHNKVSFSRPTSIHSFAIFGRGSWLLNENVLEKNNTNTVISERMPICLTPTQSNSTEGRFTFDKMTTIKISSARLVQFEECLALDKRIRQMSDGDGSQGVASNANNVIWDSGSAFSFWIIVVLIFVK